MPIERFFLGWDGPCLPRAARWLRQRFAQDASWDLSKITIALPAARATRRLLALLTQEAARGVILVPPQIITIGQLPEQLYTSPRRVAEPLEALLARVQAMRAAPKALIEPIAPAPPADDDVQGWLLLAQDFARLHEELAGAQLTVAQVPDVLAEKLDFTGSERWAALAAMEELYQQTLARHNLADPHTARAEALANQACATDHTLVLIATPDLPAVTRAMIEQAGRATDVYILVHAPEDEADHFDALGAPRMDHWQQRKLELDLTRVRVVDRCVDQAVEVLRVIGCDDDAADAGSLRGQRTADQITVGLGDPEVAPVIERTLEMSGIPARAASGRSVAASPPALLLAALGRFIAGRRFDDLASLLRHPDIEAWLQRGGDGRHDVARSIRDWLTLLDTYATEHLQSRVTDRWLGDSETQDGLKFVYDRLLSLLPVEGDEQRPLGEWVAPIGAALEQVYAHHELRRYAQDDHLLLGSLEAIGGALRDASLLDANHSLSPCVTLNQAMSIVLHALADANVPAPGGSAAVELLGWLELQLDDAPALIVTGFNDGMIPETFGPDPFIPDSARTALGLADSARRYVRDMAILTALLHSKEHLTLIASRHGSDASPLKPSRLMMARDDADLPAVVRRFYPKDPSPPAVTHVTVMTPLAGRRSAFVIPPPDSTGTLDRLRVTGFRAYLACPYRFYLQYVLRLGSLDDRAVELDPMGFGTLAHDALAAFGQSDLAHSTDAKAIEALLVDALDKAAKQRFGQARQPALLVQLEHLRERLRAFAVRQAAWTNDGWRIWIARTESSLEAAVNVDGKPFTITGRVDRIDVHDDLGYRILDYKTSDAGNKPDKTHRATRDGAKVWTDLQLPLYRDLCAPVGVTGSVQLGYINLPKKLEDVDVAIAPWTADELDSAVQQRDEVIRAIRSGRYWPPGDPPTFPDGFERICADQALDRNHLIMQAAEVKP